MSQLVNKPFNTHDTDVLNVNKQGLYDDHRI